MKSLPVSDHKEIHQLHDSCKIKQELEGGPLIDSSSPIGLEIREELEPKQHPDMTFPYPVDLFD